MVERILWKLLLKMDKPLLMKKLVLSVNVHTHNNCFNDKFFYILFLVLLCIFENKIIITVLHLHVHVVLIDVLFHVCVFVYPFYSMTQVHYMSLLNLVEQIQWRH